MNRTENYSLPQWEAQDPVRREDFNEAMASIDTMVTVGSYTGNGLELSDGGLHVELGFRPRFVIISKGWYTSQGLSASTFICTEHPNSGAEQYFTLDDTGFTVGLCSSVGLYAMKINTENNIYDFVALR